MSQNQVARYLTQASDHIDLLYQYLDLLMFTANACDSYERKDIERLHLMLSVFRSNTDAGYDELRSIVRKLKREIKLESPSETALQPQENNSNS